MRKLLTAALLVTVAACSFSQSALAQSFDNVHRCDDLAAHPNDPGRWCEGVYDDDIIPERAIKFCGDAATACPDTPRFHFQHGRALWAGKQYVCSDRLLVRRTTSAPASDAIKKA